MDCNMMKIKNIILLLASAATALSLASCGNLSLKKKETVKPPVRVKVLEVNPDSDASSAKTYVGKVGTSKNTVVLSPFPAKLEKVSVKQGQTVRANQQVAKIYSETVASTLNAARATMRQAQDGYDRLQKVRDNGSVAPVKVVEVETALARAKATLATAQKAAYDCSVKAPFAGTVSEVLVEEGEEVTLGQPLVRIVDLGSLEVQISIPETEISAVGVGSVALVTIPALSSAQFPAKLVRKGVSASAVSHSYDCSLELLKPVEGLMPGMVGKVVFSNEGALSDEPQNPVIPASIVRMDKTGKYVWAVNAQNRVEKKYITPGDFSGKGVIVLDGLESGDRVIVEGMSKVSTGMSVEVE